MNSYDESKEANLRDDTAAALAYLREQFGEGWECGIAEWPQSLGWFSRCSHGPSVVVAAAGPDPMSAARACVEAWREAVKSHEGMTGHALRGEEAHADRLAEALREAARLLRRGMAPAGNMSLEEAAQMRAREVLAAHDARKASGGRS